MAVTETKTAIRCSVKLDTGESTASGGAKTVSVNLGTLNPNAWNKDKAVSIVTALIPCFTYDWNGTVKSTTETLEGSV